MKNDRKPIGSVKRHWIMCGYGLRSSGLFQTIEDAMVDIHPDPHAHPRVLVWLRQGWEKRGGAKVVARPGAGPRGNEGL